MHSPKDQYRSLLGPHFKPGDSIDLNKAEAILAPNQLYDLNMAKLVIAELVEKDITPPRW